MKSHRSVRPLLVTLAIALATAALPAQTGTNAPAPAVPPVAAAKPALPPRTPESAVTPNNRNPKRHAEFLQRLELAPAGVLFIGDSITDGWPRKGEVSWLKFARHNPANIGISGERTEDVLWRLLNGELDGIRPKVAVVMIGTNNIGQCPDEQPAWAAAGVKRVLEVIHEKLPDTKVLLLAIFPRATADSALRRRVAAVNQIIAGFADGQKVRFLDIGASFLDAKGEIPADIMADKLHPGPKGYDVWYAAMAPTLDEMMR